MTSRRSTSRATGLKPSPILLACLAELLAAYEYAEDIGDGWQLAVPVEKLRRCGASDVDLHWLLTRKFVEHRWETTDIGHPQRSFGIVAVGPLTHQSCLVLTAVGVAFAHEHRIETPAALVAPALTVVGRTSSAATPVWDRGDAALYWQERLIRRYRKRAKYQFAILDDLQDRGWPPRIDDPLPQKFDKDPCVRLKETIKRLHRGCAPGVLRFHGDHTGQSVYWKVAERSA